MNELLVQLAAPFEPKHITWKPGKASGTTCLALTYADLRAYMERLDDLCGLEWTVAYEPWGNDRIICRLTINGVTRSSTGEMDAQDGKNGMGGTVAEAQAFKRAAAMFGLGRYLYDMPSLWVEFDAQRKRFTDAGLAKLENSYKAWYAANKPAPVRQVESTPAAQRPPAIGKAGKPLTPQQELWGAGEAVFGDDWDMARPWLIAKWTGKVTPDNTRNSSSDLSNAERLMLADYLTEKEAQFKETWVKQKGIMEKAAA